MWINGYRLIGGLVIGLNVFGKVSEVNAEFKSFTGVGVEYINPTLGTVAYAGLVAQPVANEIEDITNQYWIDNAWGQLEGTNLKAEEKGSWALIENKQEEGYYMVQPVVVQPKNPLGVSNLGSRLASLGFDLCKRHLLGKLIDYYKQR